MDIDKTHHLSSCPKPPFFPAEQYQLPQPLLIAEMLCSIYHLGGSLLDSFQCVHVSLHGHSISARLLWSQLRLRRETWNQLEKTFLRTRSMEGMKNPDQEKKAGERWWVCVTTLHSRSRTPLGEQRQMFFSLPWGMNGWLTPFHPVSQVGKGKHYLNQHFSNGRQRAY